MYAFLFLKTIQKNIELTFYNIYGELYFITL